LFGIPSRLPAGSVDTGIGASCPSSVVLCRVRTTITTSLASHPPAPLVWAPQRMAR
jgi:hypothetical protein